MNVGKLRDALRGLPQDAEVRFAVHGHWYGSERDRRSHGPAVVVTTEDGSVIIGSDTSGSLRKYYRDGVVFVDA